MNTKIVIPSLGRAKILKERTINLLKDHDKNNIYIFVIEDDYNEYKKELPDYNIIVGKLGCLEQKKFISNYFDEDEILLFLDDDIKSFYKKVGSKLQTISTGTMICEATNMMNKFKADLVGIYPAKNPFFMRGKVRQGLSFCIGQFQLLKNKKELFKESKYKILEDYERSILYFIHYKSIRLDNYSLDADYAKLLGGYQTESQVRTPVLKSQELSLFFETYKDYCFLKQKKNGKDIVFKSLYSKDPKVVQMLWIDKGKNDIFNLAIKSWIYHGYQVHLYTNNLNMVDDPNVIHIDYKTILDKPIEEILHFADLFRYKLLYSKGGLWADSDMVLINDYDFSKEECIISSEHTFKTGAFKSKSDYKPNIGILKFPIGSSFLYEVINTIENKTLNKVDECEFMKVFQKQLNKNKYIEMKKYIKKPIFSCPLPWWDFTEAYKDISVYSIKYGVMPPTKSMILETSCCLHLWNNFSNNKKKIDFKNCDFNSIYSILKNKYE